MKEDPDYYSLEVQLDHHFKDKDLLGQALTHRSYAVEKGRESPDNERLEFLGDAVLDLLVGELLFHTFPDSPEGDLTKMRASLVNERSLAARAKEIGLDGFIMLGRGEEKTGGRTKPSILANAFEAVLGAVYLDGGLEAARGFLYRLFQPLLKGGFSEEFDSDYKTRLQEWTQAKFRETPSYVLEETAGPDHNRVFQVAVHLQGELVARGQGRSKKEAERMAARRALELLKRSDIKRR